MEGGNEGIKKRPLGFRCEGYAFKEREGQSDSQSNFIKHIQKE